MKKFAVFILNLAVFLGICVSFAVYVGWHKNIVFSPEFDDGFDFGENLKNKNYAAIFKNAEENINNKDYPHRKLVASIYAFRLDEPNFKKAAELYLAEEKLRGLGFSDSLDLSLIFASGGFGVEKDAKKSDECFAKAMSLVLRDEKHIYYDDKVPIDAFFARIVDFSQSDSDLLKNEKNLLAAKMLKYALENDFHFEETSFFDLPLEQNSLMDAAVKTLRRRVLESKTADSDEKTIYIKLLLEGKNVPRDYGELFKILSGEYSNNRENFDVREIALLAALYKNGLGTAANPQKAGEILDYLKSVSNPDDFSGRWRLAYILYAAMDIYRGDENYPQDRELALTLAQMAEKNIASSNIKEAQFALGYLISFYKKCVKDYEKTEQLYKLYAPKSKEIELEYDKFLKEKK